MITRGRNSQPLPTLLILISILGSLLLLGTDVAAQTTSSGPSRHCHVSDGTFTTCPDGSQEWSDVPFKFFPETNSYLYADQADLDPTRATLSSPVDTFMLMYDECGRTVPLGPDEYFLVSLKTVEVTNGVEELVHYVIHIFTDGKIMFFENGALQPPGWASVVEGQRGKVGFGPSPNCPFNHGIAEFQIELSAAGGQSYSPDPLFWGSLVPPPPPSPPPPTPTLPRFSPQVKSRAGTLIKLISADLLRDTLLRATLCTSLLAIRPPAGEALFAACEGAEGKTTGLEFLLLIGLVAVAIDPPDSDFTVIAQPVIPPFQPVTTQEGVPQALADAINAFLTNEAQEAGLLGVLVTSIERAQAAAAAGDQPSTARQLQAAAGFATQLASAFDQEPTLRGNLQLAFQTAGSPSIPFTASDIANLQSDIAANGLPSFLLDSLTAFGVDSQTINQVTQLMLNVTPAAGSFPGFLTDPELLSDFHDFSQALTGQGAIRPGFAANTLPGNDDGSTGLVPIGLTANFFGTNYSALFVNNNGNLTFDAPLAEFTPFP